MTGAAEAGRCFLLMIILLPGRGDTLLFDMDVAGLCGLLCDLDWTCMGDTIKDCLILCGEARGDL